MAKRRFLFLTLLFGIYLGGCSSKDKEASTPEGLYQQAQNFEKNERYDLAVQRYTDIKNKHPYSQYAVKAELAIADSYYKEEDYGAAQLNYQNFRELHPTHPQIDYVIFRLGLSYFLQLPETADRDLSLSKETLQSFDDIITKYPNSTYVAEAKEKKAIVLQKLAQKENDIGEFYFKREMYDSALLRAESLLNKFPGSEFEKKGLSRAAISAWNTEQKMKAEKYYGLLKTSYPDSVEYKKVKQRLGL